MNNHPYNSNINTSNFEESPGGVEDKFKPVQNIMIPIELDTKNQIIGFFALENQELPEGGQKNLNEITGTPFKPEVAGLTVYVGPVVPNLQQNYIKALIWLADSIDRCDHSAHSRKTALWSQRIAEALGLPTSEIQDITLAGRLHDVGKSVVSREILTKVGPLNEEEWLVIKRHPDYGATLLEPSPSLSAIVPVVRFHHERFDGAGYPNRLDGESIPLGARILSVADAFSTMITGRAYRSAIPNELALEELVRCSGTQFDPDIVEIMVKLGRKSSILS
jgi:HD-GYP domain-containing protein (c-di-GMP phosphodiesterase class II)